MPSDQQLSISSTNARSPKQKPAVPVTNLDDSAVVLSERVWIDPNRTDYHPTVGMFTKAVKKRFDAEGIDLPYYTRLTGSGESFIALEQSPVDNLNLLPAASA